MMLCEYQFLYLENSPGQKGRLVVFPLSASEMGPGGLFRDWEFLDDMPTSGTYACKHQKNNNKSFSIPYMVTKKKPF